MSVNQITLIGNLGKDIKAAGHEANPISNFSVATDHVYKKDGEKITETEWTRVVAFGHSARFLNNYGTPGRQVYVTGRLRTRKYDKDGQTHYVTEVVAEDVQLLGQNPNRDRDSQAPAPAARQSAPAQNTPAPAARAPAATPAQAQNQMDDDIPF